MQVEFVRHRTSADTTLQGDQNLPPRHLWRLFTCAFLAGRLAVAHDTFDTIELPSLPAPAPIEIEPAAPPLGLEKFWLNSILRFFVPAALFPLEEPEGVLHTEALPKQPLKVSPNCAVEPLPLIEDAEAMEFEEQSGTPLVVDLGGLTPTTAEALIRFQDIVQAAGGSVAITSAYRPAAYQEHLQAVWDKWMIELRRNRSADCEALKEQVAEEFSRHGLLRSRRPVPLSDHTLGIGFDASIGLPHRLRSKRRRVSIDRLARQAGVSRPDIRRDPVHFRLIGGRV